MFPSGFVTKFFYDEGHLSYPLPYTTDSNNKVEVFSTNVDEMNTIKNNEEWTTSMHSNQDTNNVWSGLIALKKE